jgi:hypothetical protein
LVQRGKIILKWILEKYGNNYALIEVNQDRISMNFRLSVFCSFLLLILLPFVLRPNQTFPCPHFILLIHLLFTFTCLSFLRGVRGLASVASRFVSRSTTHHSRRYVYTCVSIWLHYTLQNDVRSRDYLLHE